MPSPTRRTLHYLRQSFEHVDVVERWNPFAKKRKDLFKCIDIVVIGSNQIIGVQCTSASGHSARREKILKTRAIKAWIASGAAMWLISWGKKGERGKPKRWVENLEFITLEDFENVSKN